MDAIERYRKLRFLTWVAGSRHYPLLLAAQADTYLTFGYPEVAAKDYVKTIDLAQRVIPPTSQGPLFAALAGTKLELRHYDEAIFYAEAALVMTPGWSGAVYVKAATYLAQPEPRIDEAIDLLEHLLNDQKLEPAFERYVNSLYALALAQSSKHDEVPPYIERGLTPEKPLNKPHLAENYTIAAYTYTLMGQPDAAQEHLNTALTYSDHIMRTPFYKRVQAAPTGDVTP